jgi:glycosyltransferase involved in cell wall biosynthesis
MKQSATSPSLAFLFRYGPAEHVELFPAIPRILERLAASCRIHYFGPEGRRPAPESVTAHATVHTLPWRVDRTCQRDKYLKTLRWVLALPGVCRECRRLGISAIYLDETVPLTAGLALRHFGPHVAMTIADFFPEIYAARFPLLRPAVRAFRRAELKAWRRLPLVFTRAGATRGFLVAQGLPHDRIHPVYDPCDFAVYRPVDKAAARRAFGYGERELVLVHHGILHPNKGNDRILAALPEVRRVLPEIRFLLVGDGPELGRLRQQAAALGVADIVQFTGWLPKMEEVNTALNAGDIGLVMRVGMLEDNFHATGALVHAMACGLPILAARLGGVSEIIRENESGLLFDPTRMDEFRDRLLDLAADPALRDRFGRAALARARELFDIGRVTDRTAGPLLDLARRAEAGPTGVLSSA